MKLKITEHGLKLLESEKAVFCNCCGELITQSETCYFCDKNKMGKQMVFCQKNCYPENINKTFHLCGGISIDNHIHQMCIIKYPKK